MKITTSDLGVVPQEPLFGMLTRTLASALTQLDDRLGRDAVGLFKLVGENKKFHDSVDSENFCHIASQEGSLRTLFLNPHACRWTDRQAKRPGADRAFKL